MKAKQVFIVLLLVGLAGVVFQQHRALNQCRQRLAQRELEAELDASLAGLRIPYEALLWNSKDLREISEIRLARINQMGMDSISRYNDVLHDRDNAWSPRHSNDPWNASIDHYWLNEYTQTVHVLVRGMPEGQHPINRAMRERDEETLKVIRLHVGRALKSTEEHIALASCQLWLALFEPNEDVLTRLNELLLLPKRTVSRHDEEPYRDYAAPTVEAVILIDQNSLDIKYDKDIKAGREYAHRLALLGGTDH